MPTNTKESGFEALIVNWLVEHNGYEEGSNADYNKEYAIDETRLFRFLQDTQPEQLEKLGIRKSHQKYAQFLNRLQGEISKRGIVDVLRNGIKVYPADLIMFYLTPSEGNAKAKELFQKNIFSVTRQLRYSQEPNWHWICAYLSMASRLLHLSSRIRSQSKMLMMPFSSTRMTVILERCCSSSNAAWCILP